jgi:DNA-binding FadR family transcriptional regulator
VGRLVELVDSFEPTQLHWETQVATPQYQDDERVQVPKMAEVIAARLRRRIVHGELRQDEALPSETALIGQFGVSRPTLREAFRILESESLITIRRGARGGARVNAPDGRAAARYAGLILEYRGATLRDVYDARSVIEPACAGMLAERHTADDLDALRAAAERANKATDPLTRIHLHTDFHALVVDLSKNTTLAVLSGMLRDIIDQVTWDAVRNQTDAEQAAHADHHGNRAHNKLIDLIVAKDVDGATALWRKHLDAGEEYVLAHGVSGKTVLDLL